MQLHLTDLPVPEKAPWQRTLPENWAIMDPSLILDSEGDYYIKAFVYDTKPTSEGIEGSTVYINVQ